MKRSDAETLQEYYQRINDIIDDRNRLLHENALMREQLGVGKRKPLKWRSNPDHIYTWEENVLASNGYHMRIFEVKDVIRNEYDRYIPLHEILDLIEDDE